LSIGLIGEGQTDGAYPQRHLTLFPVDKSGIHPSADSVAGNFRVPRVGHLAWRMGVKFRFRLFKIGVPVSGFAEVLAGSLKQFKDNNLDEHEKNYFVKASHGQNRRAFAAGVVCHGLRG
jgi:hypothetical protein